LPSVDACWQTALKERPWRITQAAVPAVRREPMGAEMRSMSNHIRELRGERGWSQADLAEQLGVSRQTVNAIETGKYNPSLPLAFKLAKLFGQKIEAMFAPPA
jgi:putative transcriptional regulator